MSKIELNQITITEVPSHAKPESREILKKELEQHSLTRSQFNIPQYEVAVIGAGMSGLACAKDLIEFGGQKVTVYDAQGLGGRTRSAVIGNKQTGKHLVELGGELVDESYTAVKSLSRELDEPLKDNYLPGQTHCNFAFYVDGRHVSRAELVNAIAPFVKMLNKHIDLMASGTKKGEELSALLDKTTCSEYFRMAKPPMPDWALKTLEAHIGGEWGPAATQGAKIFIENMGYEGFTKKFPNLGDEGFARYTFKNGTTSFINKMADRILNNVYKDQGIGKIESGFILKEVNLAEDGRFKLDFIADGKAVTKYADYLVMSPPPHIIKKIKFGPGVLSDARVEAHNSVEFGTDGKAIILTKNSNSPNPTDSTTFRDNFGGTKDSPIAGDNWRSDRNNMPVDGYVPRVQYIGEMDSALENLGGRRKLLAAVREDMDKQFPGGDHTGPAVISEFNTNPYAEGAYASWAPGEFERLAEGLQVHNKNDARGYREIGDTLSTTHNGYMEGAVRTGQIAAASIIGDIILRDVPEEIKEKAFI